MKTKTSVLNAIVKENVYQKKLLKKKLENAKEIVLNFIIYLIVNALNVKHKKTAYVDLQQMIINHMSVQVTILHVIIANKDFIQATEKIVLIVIVKTKINVMQEKGVLVNVKKDTQNLKTVTFVTSVLMDIQRIKIINMNAQNALKGITKMMKENVLIAIAT